MYNGVLCFHKPPGFTSHDVVAKLRGILRQKRIGHAGTLDPQATGVLVVLLGAATKASDDVTGHTKTYHTTLRLGLVTDTQDMSGTVLAENPVLVTAAEVEAVLPRFRGEIEQIPPMASAIQIDGRRLYDLARKGIEVERPARRITIHDLRLAGQEGDRFGLEVTCSKGTYIRTLCHDIGAALGCGGCMESLVRAASGPFGLEAAIGFEEVRALHEAGWLESKILPVDAVYADFSAITVNEAGAARIIHGNYLDTRHMAAGAPPPAGERSRVYLPDGSFYMVGITRPDGAVACHKTFFTKD